MRKFNLFALLFSIVYLVGCVNEDEKWAAAVTADSDEAYAEYLERFPQGKYAKEGRLKVRDYINKLHIHAYGFLGKDYEGSEQEAKKIYDKILAIDPRNALAMNNKAWIAAATLDREDPGHGLTSRDKNKIKKIMEQLEQAVQYTGRRRVSPKLYMYVLSSVIIHAAQPHTQAHQPSSSLRGVVLGNLRHLHNLLDIPMKEIDTLSDLTIKGTLLTNEGQPISGQEIYLAEGGVTTPANEASDGLAEMKVTIMLSRELKLVHPNSKTDGEGNFSFVIDADNTSLDPFLNKTLVVVSTNDQSSANFPKLEGVFMKNDKPFEFYAELDAPVMDIGKLIGQTNTKIKVEKKTQ